jgi:hypothetical protein
MIEAINSERGRAWRRLKNRMNKGKREVSREAFKPEKKWKMLYLRSEKLKRAKQLGFDYPLKSSRQILDRALHQDKND